MGGGDAVVTAVVAVAVVGVGRMNTNICKLPNGTLRNQIPLNINSVSSNHLEWEYVASSRDLT